MQSVNRNNKNSCVVYKDGITIGGFGISTTPREMGKIGQLVANNGMWNGGQVVITSEKHTEAEHNLSVYDGLSIYDRINSITN